MSFSKHIFSRLILLGLSLLAFSQCKKVEPQETHVSGKVREVSTGEPVPGVSLALCRVHKVYGLLYGLGTFSTDQKGEFSYVLNESGIQDLAIEVKPKAGYFRMDTTRYFDLRFQEKYNLTFDLEKAATLNVRLKDVTHTIDGYWVWIAGREVTDTAGNFAPACENKEKGTEKNFRIYVRGNDSIHIDGYQIKSNAHKRVYQSHLLTLPGKEYDITIEY